MEFNRITPIGILCVWAIPVIAYADYGLHMYLGDFNHSGAGKTTVDNASSVFNNPAAMSLLGTPQFEVDASYFRSTARFENQGSTDALSAPLTGDNGGDPGNDTLVPGIYYSHRLSEKWSVGGAVNVPFGLETEWDNSTWVGRYQSVKIGIETININPSVSFKIDDVWSVGAGVSIQQAKAELSNAIDFGAVCLQLLSPAACAGIGLPAPQAADGFIKVDGDDWGIGYNLGALYRTSQMRVGISYRSKIDYTLEGNADFTIPAQAIVFDPAFTDTTGSVDITLPEVLSVGIALYPSETWSFFADASWTRWSRIKEYRIRFANPDQPDQVIPRNWQDTWRIAFGADYHVDSKWTVQGGIAYAESAIPDDYFDPTLPTTDAYWLNIGTQYDVTKSSSLSFGYAHIIFEERRINYTGTYGETVRGVVDPELNVFNVKYSHEF